MSYSYFQGRIRDLESKVNDKDSDPETLTNKTIDGDNNTISNLNHGDEVDNPSSGVHGVTGSVVGTSDTQTLTNKTIAVSQITELSNLTDAEGAQLENINSVTISNTQWGYLGGLFSAPLEDDDLAANGGDVATESNANTFTQIQTSETTNGVAWLSRTSSDDNHDAFRSNDSNGNSILRIRLSGLDGAGAGNVLFIGADSYNFDAPLSVDSNDVLDDSDIGSAVQAQDAQLQDLADNLTASAAELNQADGVTSSIIEALNLDGYIRGFVPQRSTSTALSFDPGVLIVGGKSYSLGSSLLKSINTTWAEGHEQGGKFSGATIGNTDDYYAIAISKDSSPSTIDIGFDDNEDGTNAPTGWTVLKEVFRGMTNSSGEIDDFDVTETAGGGIRVRLGVMQEEFTDTNPGVGDVTKTMAFLPPSSLGRCYIRLRTSNGTTTATLTLRETWQISGGAGEAGATNAILIIRGDGVDSQISTYTEITPDSSRQIEYELSASAADISVTFSVEGYTLERR